MIKSNDFIFNGTEIIGAHAKDQLSVYLHCNGKWVIGRIAVVRWSLRVNTTAGGIVLRARGRSRYQRAMVG